MHVEKEKTNLKTLASFSSLTSIASTRIRLFASRIILKKNKKMSNRLVFCVGLVFCLVIAAWAQSDDDAASINPEICGMSSQKASSLLRERRFPSAAVADQSEWGWQVLLINKDGFMSSGSLINSQWVLAVGYDHE